MTTSAENPPNQAVADPDAMTHRQILEALTGLLAALFTEDAHAQHQDVARIELIAR